MESTSGEDVMKIVEMITKNLEYYINLVNKTGAEFGRIDSNFERNSNVGKCYQRASHATNSFIHKGKSRLMQKTSSLPYSRKLPHPYQPLATTTVISQQSSKSRQDPPSAKILQLFEGSDDD